MTTDEKLKWLYSKCHTLNGKIVIPVKDTEYIMGSSEFDDMIDYSTVHTYISGEHYYPPIDYYHLKSKNIEELLQQYLDFISL